MWSWFGEEIGKDSCEMLQTSRQLRTYEFDQFEVDTQPFLKSCGMH